MGIIQGLYCRATRPYTKEGHSSYTMGLVMWVGLLRNMISVYTRVVRSIETDSISKLQPCLSQSTQKPGTAYAAGPLLWCLTWPSSWQDVASLDIIDKVGAKPQPGRGCQVGGSQLDVQRTKHWYMPAWMLRSVL